VGGADLAVLVGVAGAGKSTMLEAARRAWEAQGFSVKGAALAGIAAENLEIASAINARTLASWERSWEQGYELLGAHDLLVIDEAGSPFRGITARIGAAELTEVRRQRVPWQRQATKLFATGRTSEALAAYERQGRVRVA